MKRKASVFLVINGLLISLLFVRCSTNSDSGIEPPNSTNTNNNQPYAVVECTTNEVANPNYDASKGYSAGTNEPTIRTQSCQDVWKR